MSHRSNPTKHNRVRRLALGLFHFNPHWGADPISQNRHCNEAIGPFLKIFKSHPNWKASFEISGAGLEILATHYRAHFESLCSLVFSGQLELISALYTPALWIAFPEGDLLRSIERNRNLLLRLGLPVAPIFFAQEAFFGEGVRALTPYFEMAVCKDDYLNYLYEMPRQRPIRKMGDMRVIVASGHLLCESVLATRQRPDLLDAFRLSYRHRSYIRDAEYLNELSNFPARTGRIANVEWYWYHCGDGNHFACIAKPCEDGISMWDERWSRWNEGVLERIEQAGFELSTIGEFTKAVPMALDEPLPLLIEGGWNSRTSNGPLRWMGQYSNPWENDNLILTTIARARLRLATAERHLGPDTDVRTLWKERMAAAWDAVLDAECSDYFGWNPTEKAVSAGIRAAETALSKATEIFDALVPWSDPGQSNPSHLGEFPKCLASFEPVLVGAIGSGEWTQIEQDCWIWEVRLRSTELESGLRFRLRLDHLAFSPSAQENRVARVSLSALKPEVISLPLANGLVQLDKDWYLVKDVTRIHVAAQVNKAVRTITFSISGAHVGQRHLWTFYLVHGDERRALEFANRLNGCGENDSIRQIGTTESG